LFFVSTNCHPGAIRRTPLTRVFPNGNGKFRWENFEIALTTSNFPHQSYQRTAIFSSSIILNLYSLTPPNTSITIHRRIAEVSDEHIPRTLSESLRVSETMKRSIIIAKKFSSRFIWSIKRIRKDIECYFMQASSPSEILRLAKVFK
jgi:hypothetical protein